jgi:hypothetical protein
VLAIVAAIRTLLSDGKLHAQGRVERNGRDVLRLVGTTKRYVDAGGTFTPETVYEYFTDPRPMRRWRSSQHRSWPRDPTIPSLQPVASAESSNVGSSRGSSGSRSRRTRLPCCVCT